MGKQLLFPVYLLQLLLQDFIKHLVEVFFFDFPLSSDLNRGELPLLDQSIGGLGLDSQIASNLFDVHESVGHSALLSQA